jgi:filamentous hemagglutinin family protein
MNTMNRPTRDLSTNGLVRLHVKCVAAGANTSRSPHGARQFAIKALCGSMMLALATSSYADGLVGGVVTGGVATINTSGSYTTITQSTSNVVINWDSFSIGTGQTVEFVQPGSESIALNRVIGTDPSVILGNLNSNGKVFLLNPNGILFGNGSSVNVGGLVATTMNITDADFMAGNYAFTGAGNGTILNEGTINATGGGYVALMGRNVSNQGVISARLGSVVLAAGEAVTLDVAGDGLLNVSVSQGAVNA